MRMAIPGSPLDLKILAKTGRAHGVVIQRAGKLLWNESVYEGAILTGVDLAEHFLRLSYFHKRQLVHIRAMQSQLRMGLLQTASSKATPPDDNDGRDTDRVSESKTEAKAELPSIA